MRLVSAPQIAFSIGKDLLTMMGLRLLDSNIVDCNMSYISTIGKDLLTMMGLRRTSSINTSSVSLNWKRPIDYDGIETITVTFINNLSNIFHIGKDLLTMMGLRLMIPTPIS